MSTSSTTRSAANERIIWNAALFVSLLIALNLAIITLLPASYLEMLRRMTGRIAALLLSHFGDTTFDGMLLSTNGFIMQIAIECTAMHLLTIYIAGVIAYPHHGAMYKLFGIVAGTVVLLLMNGIRIVVLGLVGAYVPGAFEFVHLYLWEGIFALLVIIVWVVWVRKLVVHRPLVVNICIALMVSAIGVGVLSTYMPTYLEALVAGVRPLAGLVLGNMPHSLAVSQDLIELNVGNSVFWTSMIGLNAYTQLIFLALMATTFDQGRRITALKHTVYGLGVIFLLLLGHLMLFILEVSYGMSMSNIEVLDVVIRTFSVSACIGLYHLFTRKLRVNRKNLADQEGGRINEEIVSAY